MTQAITSVTGRAVPVPGNDIDTDRIIPAKFMKCVTFDGLGQYAFHDERFDEQGQSKSHPLDAPQHQGANILLSGSNFGCGSSREHAPQALKRFGIDAIIAENFAEIFFGNSTKIGLVCVSLNAADMKTLQEWATQNPDQNVTIDLPKKTISAGDHTWTFEQKPAATESLLKGTYDPLTQLLANQDAIRKTAQSLPYMSWN